MFGFGKKKKQQQEQQEQQNAQVTQKPKAKKGIDKLVMGAIIGVAVGSVVGMAVAPQKGKDTRKFITDKSKEALEKGKEMGQKIIDLNQTKKQQKKFSGFLKKLFQKKSSKKSLEKESENMKKIPHEIEEN